MVQRKPIIPIIEELHNLPPSVTLFNIIKGHPYSFFLDSACGYERLGRFSILGCDPFLVFKCKGDLVTFEWRDGKIENFKANPFIALRDVFKRYPVSGADWKIPCLSGAVGYFAYDLKNFIEDLPDDSADDIGIPDCILGFYDTTVTYDNLKKRVYITSSGLPEVNSVDNLRRKKERLREFKDSLFCGIPERDQGPVEASRTFLRSNFTKCAYLEAIEKAKGYIKRGDIYQVNLSQRFETELRMAPFELYLRLRTYSPAPFSSYLGFKDTIIASSSPERFLLKRGDYIETRPIKGTRPRGEDDAGDLSLKQELLSSLKDRAEHIMIVDLERNDLGRICRYGSIRPTESLALESYANVFHLVSTVAGRLEKAMDPIDCLLATFPGGSITGAPKIRAMEIIGELEPVKRSVYTGAIGYISFDGNMDTSIAIRTFIIKDRKAYFQVGGGIVADSLPEEEYEETIHKAKGLIEALGGGLLPEVRREAAPV